MDAYKSKELLTSVLLTIACAVGLHLPRIVKNLMNGAVQVSTAITYGVTLVDLRLPVATADSSDLLQALENEAILERAVKETRSTLYVHVGAAYDTPTANVLSYISAIYQRLWDDMTLHGRSSLNCIVSGDVDEACFQNRSQLYHMASLEAVYTKQKDYAVNHNQDRAFLSGLRALAIPELTPLPLDKRGRASGGALHFFDARDAKLPTFKVVAMGGTFDRLHNGHKKLLTLAASVCTDRLIVGVMGDELLKGKKNALLIASFADRKKAVLRFLTQVKPAQTVELVELTDPFGPTITDASVEAIVVSSETLSGATRINSIRGEKAMDPLHVLISNRSDVATLSSTFLRNQSVSV